MCVVNITDMVRQHLEDFIWISCHGPIGTSKDFGKLRVLSFQPSKHMTFVRTMWHAKPLFPLRNFVCGCFLLNTNLKLQKYFGTMFNKQANWVRRQVRSESWTIQRNQMSVDVTNRTINMLQKDGMIWFPMRKLDGNLMKWFADFLNLFLKIHKYFE